jgi:DedD protein
MSLFSLFRKNKQEAASGAGEFRSPADGDSEMARGRSRRKRGTGASDPVLPEKKRARRRLVGAVALVLAAVIGLPMILDSEPPPLADDIAIQIPSQEQFMPPSAAVESSAAPAGVGIAESLDETEEVVEIAPAPGAPVSSAPAARVPAEPAPRVAEPAPQVAAPAAEESDDGARALAILQGKFAGKPVSAPAAADGRPEQFSVQVAALANKDKVDELRGRLRNAGIATYTQMVATATGEHTRIRIGPFSSREQADDMRTKLTAMGLNGTVVPVNQ